MVKRFSILILFFIQLNLSLFSSVFNICTPTVQEPEVSKKDVLKDFKPDFYIKDQIPQDLILLEKMRDLFFEPDPVLANDLVGGGKIKCNPKRNVYTKAIQQYGAQEVVLLTDDYFRLSSLYFKRQNAPLNIVYVTGYFNDQTPTKEWAAPFSIIYPNFNILAFDPRSFGDSEGKKSKLSCDYGTNAYLDIQAAVDFFRKENDKPIILVGFCAGAAMALEATLQAQARGKNIADAIVFNSIFTKFENQLDRAILAEDRWFYRILLKSGYGAFYLNFTLNGSLFDLNPIEVIGQINIPCYFEHFTQDPFAILSEGVEVFKEVRSFKMFLQSDIGRHVRIHSKAPYQYRNAFYGFLEKSGLISSTQLLTLLQKDEENVLHDLKNEKEK